MKLTFVEKKVIDLCARMYRKWTNSVPIIVSVTYIEVCFVTFFIHRVIILLHFRFNLFFLLLTDILYFFANMRKSKKWQVKCYGLYKDVFHITIIICIILFFFRCIMQSDVYGQENYAQTYIHKIEHIVHICTLV